MNADRLLALYDRVADAPDAIARLRRFVLDLAVRGKLVAQDPADKPMARVDRELSPSVAPPFSVPNGWQWARLRSLGPLKGGGTPSKARDDFWEGDIPWVSPKDMKVDYIDTSQLRITEAAIAGSAVSLIEAESLLFVVRGMILAHSFPVAICRVPVTINQDMKALSLNKPEMSEYILRALKGLAPEMLARVQRSSHGTCRIEGANYSDFLIPLPPLAEQRRIVAKVDELMALLDRLEAARSQREAARDRLTAASLARLTAEADPETARAHARFALDTLPALTTRPDQIKTLRQTILNLAVRGKLVDQDPADEPAAALLKRIAAEKARLVKAGLVPREKALPALSEDDKAFELPPGWAWVRLGKLSQFVTSGSRDWAKHYSNEGAIFVRMGNLSRGHYRLRLDRIQRVKPPADGEGTRTRLEAGDILISITGDVGMLGLIPEDFGESYINQHTAMVRPMAEMKGRYLAELFRSPFAQNQFNEPQRGIKNSFRLTDVTQFVVPLPPLAEQHRIVAKVDALMALCDRLETALADADATRQRLLEALLHEALAPAVPALEAAE